MSLLKWIMGLLKPAPLRRDVSRLGGPGDSDLDTIEEVIDTSGGPLKPDQRRRALRDRRLLPKKRPKNVYGRKRPKYMTAAEANRLFSPTLRTRNRNIRDLLPDEEQLQRLGLPLWLTEDDLAKALGITTGHLRHFSIHRERERAPHYVTFSIPKRTGGRRTIMAPKKRLKKILRQINAMLVSKLPVSQYAHGFRAGRSIKTAAAPHAACAAVIHMDIKDFFPSVHFGRVRGLLIHCGYSYPVAATLAVLMTEAERQPVEIEGEIFHVPITSRYCVQGATTSPGLCNAILAKLDKRLAGLAQKLNAQYTRYADDLTFSFKDEPGKKLPLLIKVAREIIQAEGFTINSKKTRVMRHGRRQTVTGVVVNETVGLSRQERRRMRALAHRLSQMRANGSMNPQLLNYFRGRLAYLHMLNPAQADKLKPDFMKP